MERTPLFVLMAVVCIGLLAMPAAADEPSEETITHAAGNAISDAVGTP